MVVAAITSIAQGARTLVRKHRADAPRPLPAESRMMDATTLPLAGSTTGPGTADRIRAWAARYPVAAFLGILFGIGYPVMALPVLADHGLIPGGWLPGTLGMDAERVASVLLIFVALIPATLVATWAAEGRHGIRSLLRRMVQWRFGTTWWVLVLLGLPALTITFAVMLGDTLRPVDAASLAIGQVFALATGFLLVNLWEEAGWTGFVQTRLERRHGLVFAAILTAVPFALIHMPLHFIGDFSLDSFISALLVLLVVCVFFRLLIGVLRRGTRDSILAVALRHTVFNKSNNGDGIVAALVEGNARGAAALLATIALTLAIAIFSRRRLSRAYRMALDASPAPNSKRIAVKELP
jgi:membrane protease YdiL (CAAX protease family)